MKRYTAIIFTLALLVSASLTSAPGGGEDKKDLLGAGALSDMRDRFRVGRASFDYRFLPDGSGEAMDIIFDIHNNTQYPVKLKYITLAMYETDKVDKTYRQLVPYSTWRERDYEKEEKQIFYATSAPFPMDINLNNKDGDIAKIWEIVFKEEKQLCLDAKNKAEQCEYAEKKRRKEVEYGRLFPPMWSIVRYLVENHAKFGHEFLLPGITLPDPQKTSVNLTKNDPPGNGLLYHNRVKSTVISTHVSRYRPDFLLFNKAMVIILEPETGQVLYRRFYRFKRPLKMQ